MQITCNYCHDIYSPRAQVKSPKACNSPKCQKLRQRDNERDWQKKNQGIYDKKYHQIKRSVRQNEVNAAVEVLIKSLSTGLLFYKFSLNPDHQILIQIISALGIRLLNKLCIPVST